MNGKFVIYSGGSRTLNKKLDKALIKLCKPSKELSITYVPVSDNQDPKYFKQFKKYYQHYGFKKFCYFALDKDNTNKTWKAAFASDVIYLDGGNTYQFLHNMEKSNIKKHLKYFIDKGGIVAGQSAGIICISPNIKTAAIPTVDADENFPGFKKKKGLNLVNFEFSPHFSYSDKKSKEELKKYSSITKNEIIACDDGSGIILDGDKMTLVGSVYSFKNGIVQQKN
jgi:dipeptidase E